MVKEVTAVQKEMVTDENMDWKAQADTLEQILMQSSTVSEAIKRAKTLRLDEYYIGAGCVTQTVWNHLSGNPLEYGIKDIDFVYYDRNLEAAAENRVIARVRECFSGLAIPVDTKNEARVHLWYESHFGYAIAAYESLEAAIATWPTTATAVGVREKAAGGLEIYAPFGLNDLFSMTVRANKRQITKEIYERKVRDWLQKWPGLHVIPWDETY